MACRLIGAKPLSEPMLDYCQLDPHEHISVKIWSKYNNFHWPKCTWNCRLRNGVHLVSASMCVLRCLLDRCPILQKSPEVREPGIALVPTVHPCTKVMVVFRCQIAAFRLINRFQISLQEKVSLFCAKTHIILISCCTKLTPVYIISNNMMISLSVFSVFSNLATFWCSARRDGVS